jgi:hypothetical protein
MKIGWAGDGRAITRGRSRQGLNGAVVIDGIKAGAQVCKLSQPETVRQEGSNHGTT